MTLLRRLALPAALAAVLIVPAHAVASSGSWNRSDQRKVVKAGLMERIGGSFRGQSSMSTAAMRAALSKLGERSATPAAHVSSARLTVARFDALLVRQLGLTDLARAVQEQARHAGLHPPGRFSTEVVARQLGLRFNHPFPSGESLELYPTDRITRAEAAYSFARVLGFSGWETQYARDVLGRFVLPAYTSAQKRALRVAVSKIGMPYIWGGEYDRAGFGQIHGGYDCSGFAWRVYKLSGNPAGRRIGGRTAAQQAGEIRTSQRIPFGKIEPGDLLFFGSAGFHSRASERSIVHEGIALSGEFMIHASDEGVYVSPLFEDWRRGEFAWARRVL